MKQLTGFIPIAALPESTEASAKKHLLETIEWLHKEGAATETNLKLLTAIVESIVCSEESYTRFLQCGFDAAIKFFDTNSQNWEFLLSQRHHLIIPEIGMVIKGDKATTVIECRRIWGLEKQP
ncbi:hypothetical protein [Nostoc sp. C052]|uniref:hypothetical protein n=1 Tax=Nostoc sp. C052 TaxID=2576902 RepID=UPI00211802D1|nr:hypothetical protein [Nostoc sp. C052]